jgi:hypothetical protein
MTAARQREMFAIERAPAPPVDVEPPEVERMARTVGEYAACGEMALADEVQAMRFRLLDSHRRGKGSAAKRLAGRMLAAHGDGAAVQLAVLERIGRVAADDARRAADCLRTAGVPDALPLTVAIGARVMLARVVAADPLPW